jgi:hypothetical protein
MLRRHCRPLALLLPLALVSSPLCGQEPAGQKLPEAARKAESAVREHLKKGPGEPQLLWKNDPALGQVFDGTTFIVARYRIYPIARAIPEGLKPSNVFAVGGAGKVQLIPDVPALEKFFRAHARPVRTPADAKAALAAWLTLAQEFHQDGMYKFEVLTKEFGEEKTGDGQLVRGRAIVTQGGNGELNATLTFADGKLTKAAESSKIRSGPRPICQATKLLDADPIVRRMAEQDLLIMGLSARAYVREQRAGATPELRNAIDRLWRKIEANGW